MAGAAGTGLQRDENAVPVDRGGRINVAPGSLGAIVRSYKSAVTKHINELTGLPGQRIWQRNYHEHVIRSDDELQRIRLYIAENPQRWEGDDYNPTSSTCA